MAPEPDPCADLVADLVAENQRLRRALYRACVEVDVPEGVTVNHEDGTAHIDGSSLDHEPDNPQGVWCCEPHRQEFFDRHPNLQHIDGRDDASQG